MASALRRRMPAIVIVIVAALGAGLLAASRGLAPEPAAEEGAAGAVDWQAALAALPDEGFARLPDDWTLRVPDDHGAHAAARTETWSVTAHLETEAGEPLGLQLALVRVALMPPDAPDEGAWVPRALYLGHAALVEEARGRAVGEGRFNRAVLGLAGHDAARREVRLDDWAIAYGEGADGGALRLAATAPSP